MLKIQQKLYILPFDHRGSFLKIFGFVENTLTPEQTAAVISYKKVIYEGFLRALKRGVPKTAAAILVDEQFGADIHRDAQARGLTRILTTEKSGQDEFDLQYGQKFGEHIEQFCPDYVKVLVRYNIEGDKVSNARQADRLKIVNDFCRAQKYKFLFELLVAPTKDQLAICGGDESVFEKTRRGELMAAAIKELQMAGIEPNVWKLEGLENLEHMKQVVGAARSGGRSNVGIVVLGRGESEAKVRQWLTVAAKIPGVIGFAVGRTVFKPALLDLWAKKITSDQASEIIAQNYKGFVDLFEAAAKK